MRIALYKYIEANKNKLYNTESQIEIGNLLPSAYIRDSGYNFKRFYDEFLLSMNNEAEKIIIYLSPIIFEVNMDLYIFEGTAKVDKRNITFFKQYIPSIFNENLKINMLYRLAHYDLLYSINIIDNFNKLMYFKSYNSPDRSSRVKIIGEEDCETCKKKSQIVEFSHMQGVQLCKSCLTDYLKKVIMTRIKSYTSENYNNIECIYYIK
jgi:hypothetical protein